MSSSDYKDTHDSPNHRLKYTSGQSDGYDDMRHRIQNIYARHHGRYGYRRITAHLHNEGAEINHKTVQKLMMQMNLKAKRRKQHYHSYKGNISKVAPNVLARDFDAARPNQKWTTDVTQVNIREVREQLIKGHSMPIHDVFVLNVPIVQQH